MAQLVEADVEVEPGGLDRWGARSAAEGVARDGGALAGGEQQIVWTHAASNDPCGELTD